MRMLVGTCPVCPPPSPPYEIQMRTKYMSPNEKAYLSADDINTSLERLGYVLQNTQTVSREQMTEQT